MNAKKRIPALNKFLISLSVILFFVSCKNETSKNESTPTANSYFDLAKIVRDDININTRVGVGEEKIVTINGKTETKKVSSINWKKELQLLSECDLNKPSWKGKFDVTILNDSLKYVYTANSDKISVRKMTVNYEQKNGSIASVEIEKKIATILFKTEQQISYFPQKSFTIKAIQKAIFMRDFNSEVEIKYLNSKI